MAALQEQKLVALMVDDFDSQVFEVEFLTIKSLQLHYSEYKMLI
jgi:hypothetical protein